MSDNTVLPPGGGGDNIRTVDRSGVKSQVVLLDLGGEAGPEQLVDTATPLPVGLQQLAFRFDGSATPILYIGEAAPGSLEGAAVWRIQKVDTTSPSNISFKWANGSAEFNQIWTNRASLTYS